MNMVAMIHVVVSKTIFFVAVFLSTISISVKGKNCTKEQFDCKDGTCIYLANVCDISFDCPTNADEENCTGNNCPEGLIRCSGVCKFECETTTLQPTTIEITTTNEVQTTTDEVTTTLSTTSEIDTTSTTNHVTTTPVSDSPTTKPGDNYIITTPTETPEAGFNLLYLLLILLIIPIILIIFCIIRYQDKMRDFIYHLRKEKNSDNRDNFNAMHKLT